LVIFWRKFDKYGRILVIIVSGNLKMQENSRFENVA